MNGLRKFVEEQSVVAVGVGLVVGLALKDFVENFIYAFITPILNKIFGGASSIDALSLDIFGIQFKPGVFVNASINFFFVVLVVYGFVKMFSNMKYSSSSKPSKK